MSYEVTSDRKKPPFVMFPDNLIDDQRLFRLRRKGGFEFVGLYFHLCFLLHRCREDGREGSMPLDMDDPESFGDLVYRLHPMEENRIREAIELMISIGLLKMSEIDRVRYACSPVMREAVLNIKRLSQLQSDRRKGINRNNQEGSQEDDLGDVEPMSYNEFISATLKSVPETMTEPLAKKFYSEVVCMDHSGKINENNVGDYLSDWLRKKQKANRG